LKIADLAIDRELAKAQGALVRGGMFPASTNSGGANLVFPDVCKTPLTDPITYTSDPIFRTPAATTADSGDPTATKED